MTWIVRKISRPKWNPLHDSLKDSVQADAITLDLRTNSNQLSFWECEHDRDFSSIALALASVFERLDTVDLAWVEKNEATELGIKFCREPGETALFEMRDSHINAVNLDLSQLCGLGRLLAQKIREEEKYKRFTQKEVKQLLIEAVQTERIQVENLKEKVQAKIRSSLD